MTELCWLAGYGYRNRMSAYTTYSQAPPVSFSSNQAVYPATYSSYPQYQPSYSYSNNYPIFQTYPSKPSYSSWYSSYPSTTYTYSPTTYQRQQPSQYQMSYMLNDLTYPATFSSSPSSSSPSATSSSSSSSSSSSPVVVSSSQEQSPAWQGGLGGTISSRYFLLSFIFREGEWSGSHQVSRWEPPALQSSL